MSDVNDEALVRALRTIAQPASPPKPPWWQRWIPFPVGWQARDWRAMFALVASVAGAAVLTGGAAWIAKEIADGAWPPETAAQRLDALKWAMFGALMIVGIVLISLGLAVNRRVVKGSIGRDGASFEASGGEGEDPPPVAEVKTTTTITTPAQTPAPQASSKPPEAVQPDGEISFEEKGS